MRPLTDLHFATIGLDVWQSPLRDVRFNPPPGARVRQALPPILALIVLLSTVFGGALSIRPASAQSQDPHPSERRRVDERLSVPFNELPAPSGSASPWQDLEQKLEAVSSENRRLAAELQGLRRRLDAAEPTLGAPPPPGFDPAASAAAPAYAEWPGPATFPVPRYFADYDNGFQIAPVNPEDTPFSLKINNQTAFRYSGFARDELTWTDSAGNVLPIENSSNLQIPRGRLIFSGMALRPELTYLLSIDYNTVNSNPLGFRAYELGYRFSRGLQVRVGQTKVPGTREWNESAFSPLEGPDRSMATTFFRPSLSQGIWFLGEPVDNLHYIAMFSNGFNTLNLRPSQISQQLCWSGSTWWEPWGAFGRGFADLEHHQNPVIRVGTSYTFAFGQGSQSDSDAVENSSVRLSDGTVITQVGAFAPGVTLQSYDLSLAAFDAAVKYQGMSLSSEFFLQNLTSLEGNGPLPLDATQACGAMIQGGCFVVPQSVELYSRYSFVTGAYGSGSEVGGGLNWFPLRGQNSLRFTFDTTWLDSSSASQNRTGYVAGQSGLLVRTQIAASF